MEILGVVMSVGISFLCYKLSRRAKARSSDASVVLHYMIYSAGFALFALISLYFFFEKL